MRYSAKRDDNEAQIVDALEACGATVQRLDAKGVPDLLVGYRNQNLLMEVKAHGDTLPTIVFVGADKRLTHRQREWLSKWNGQWTIVSTPNEAMKVLQEVAG